MWRWYFYWDSKFGKGKKVGGISYAKLISHSILNINTTAVCFMCCDRWMEHLKYSAILPKILWVQAPGALVYHFDIHLLFFHQVLDNPQDILVFLKPFIKKEQSKNCDAKFLFLQSLTSLFIGTRFPFAQDFSSTFIWHNWGVYNLGMSKQCQHISDKQGIHVIENWKSACI